MFYHQKRETLEDIRTRMVCSQRRKMSEVCLAASARVVLQLHVRQAASSDFAGSRKQLRRPRRAAVPERLHSVLYMLFFFLNVFLGSFLTDALS